MRRFAAGVSVIPVRRSARGNAEPVGDVGGSKVGDDLLELAARYMIDSDSHGDGAYWRDTHLRAEVCCIDT
ncbi:hypothetical protein GCM10009556_019460 [Acrocarpospora pleiomorpha]